MIKMVSKKMKNQKGFTLVELIVVIAIIGILGAIAVPKFGGFRETAAEKADEATMDVIRNAVMVTLANGDIEGSGTITIDTSEASTVFTKSNDVKINGTTIQNIMKKLLGEDIKAQITDKTGFEVTIKTNGDVDVKYK